MADDKTKTGWQDDTKINIHQDYEVAYWSQRLGITPAQLRQVVARAGPSVAAVRRALGR